ncbi:MAG: YfhO family protein, partial [Acidobacteria bacterium]|nr:YfhO family protein [Acidobacteriota bacterium]
DVLVGRWRVAGEAPDPADARRLRRARLLGVVFPAGVGALLFLFAVACLYTPTSVTTFLSAFAQALGDAKGDEAAEWMLRTVRQTSGPIILLTLAVAALFGLLTSSRWSEFGLAGRYVLATVIAVDLVARAWGINPTLDAGHFAQPHWLSYVKTQPDARFYVGGKREGSLSGMDIDGSRGYIDAPGLEGSASRAALSIQAAFYPSAWQAREVLTYDLPVLWPRDYLEMSNRFFDGGIDVRERLLDRTGVRYRVLPQRRAGDRVPLTPIPQFYESFLYDFGDAAAARASIVPTAQVVPQVERQIEALFEDGWDSRQVVLVDRPGAPLGTPGPPVEPYAHIVEDAANHTVIDSGVDSEAGYLVFLDSYSDDWQATVDGQPASIARANGLWRAVHLAPGKHRVEFRYRPRALAVGATISAAGLLCVLGLFFLGPKRENKLRHN